MKRILIVASVLALLGAAPAGAQLDMSNYVALGDSATAGLVSGGLVDCYQHLSYPALLAHPHRILPGDSDENVGS